MDIAVISDRLKQVLHDLESVTTMFENFRAESQKPSNDDFLTRGVTQNGQEE